MNFCAAILILKVEEDMQHFWHIVLHYFKKGKNATEMQEKICALYGEGAVTDQMCQKGFAKFPGPADTLARSVCAVGCLVHWKVCGSTLASAH